MLNVIFMSVAVFYMLGIGYCEVDIVSSEHREKLNQMAMECLKETGAGKDELVSAVEPGMCVRHPKSDCFTACMGQKLHGFSHDGHLEEEVIREIMQYKDTERAMEIFETCSKLKGANECDTAGMILECVCKKYHA